MTDTPTTTVTLCCLTCFLPIADTGNRHRAAKYCSHLCDRSRRPWSALEVDRLVKLYEDGKKYHEIGAALRHVSKSGYVTQRSEGSIATKVSELIHAERLKPRISILQPRPWSLLAERGQADRERAWPPVGRRVPW